MSIEKATGGDRGREVVAGAGSGGGGSIDPSNLHLKKELTQIRKAARVLRDPGTSSSWRSPINSARSLTKHHYVHQHKNGQINGNDVASSSQQFSQPSLEVQSNVNNNYTAGNADSDKGNVNVKEKERRVFLYNWRGQKFESVRSKQIGEADVDNSKDEGSFSTHDDESVDVDSLTNARNVGGNDSRSDAYPSAVFKCKDIDFTPSIKKSRRSNYYSANIRHQNEILQKQIIMCKRVKNNVEALPGLGLAREDLVSLVDQSDHTEDYCNLEDLRRASTLSPLLARLKHKGWDYSSTKLLMSRGKEDDSISYSTPALSTSSHNKYRNPSNVESWDATTGSFNDADDEVDDQLDLPGRQGCGIPCYWSKRSTPKSRIGHGSCCSPSLSDSLRRKGSSIFCGSHSMQSQRRRHRPSLGSNKRLSSRTANQSLVPLLTNNNIRGGSSTGSGNSDDKLSTSFGELDLEALSRLDGRRWSTSCRSQDGLELLAYNGEVQEEGSPENARSLSHKYRPMFFDELIGQNIIVQSLMNAISNGRIATVYLFQGPRGTGKTSMARIFAAALNCLATDETKPCGVCRECTEFVSDKSRNIREVDGSNEKEINQVKNLLKSVSVVHPSAPSQFKVVVFNECHLLPSKAWLAFLQLLEKPLPHVVFILITTDIDNVPRTIMSRCQKHIFNKISNSEIVTRLKKIAMEENLDAESDAMELIASNADGSLRDAETMMDQLSLFGKRITISLVNELIGVVSDEKLLDLLEIAMSSNATETVIKAREMLDTGVDPIVLMSQMATLIVDIIAGTYPTSVDGKPDSFFGAGGLSERELDKLKHALSLLSEAEKHLRASSERSTWFTATLLQLGSMSPPDQTHPGSSRRKSTRATEEDYVTMLKESTVQKQRTDAHLAPENSGSSKVFSRSAHCDSNIVQSNVSRDDCKGGGRGALRCVNSKMLTGIWLQCIDKCHSKTLRQLLHSHGRLMSISEVKGDFLAHIAFGDRNIKTRAEGFLSSITNSFEIVLRRNVEVKITLLPDSFGQKQTDKGFVVNPETTSLSFNMSEDRPMEVEPPCAPISGNANTGTSKESKSDIPLKRIESIIHEQRLETAWLQAMEKGTPGSMSRSKPERNQILPQDGSVYPPLNELEPANSGYVPLQHWEDELNHEIKAVKINGGKGMASHKDQISKRVNHYPLSPSLLHDSSNNFSLDTMGYESGSAAAGCSGMLCWNNSRRRTRVKGKQGTPLRACRSGRFSWFGECAKSRTDNRYNK